MGISVAVGVAGGKVGVGDVVAALLQFDNKMGISKIRARGSIFLFIR
jgi:hypothetical protein